MVGELRSTSHLAKVRAILQRRIGRQRIEERGNAGLNRSVGLEEVAAFEHVSLAMVLGAGGQDELSGAFRVFAPEGGEGVVIVLELRNRGAPVAEDGVAICAGVRWSARDGENIADVLPGERDPPFGIGSGR